MMIKLGNCSTKLPISNLFCLKYFSSFKNNQKLIEFVKNFKDYDIDGYILPNNDPHNVFLQ